MATLHGSQQTGIDGFHFGTVLGSVSLENGAEMTRNDLIQASNFLRRVVPRGWDEENELLRLIAMFENQKPTDRREKVAQNG